MNTVLTGRNSMFSAGSQLSVEHPVDPVRDAALFAPNRTLLSARKAVDGGNR